MLSEKYRNELDKLIGIATNYRDGTLSRSLFMDVIFSLPEIDRKTELCENYIVDKGVQLVSGDDDVEDVKGVKKVKTLSTLEIANRYTVQVKGKETFLYEDCGKWFVEMRT